MYWDGPWAVPSSSEEVTPPAFSKDSGVRSLSPIPDDTLDDYDIESMDGEGEEEHTESELEYPETEEEHDDDDESVAAVDDNDESTAAADPSHLTVLFAEFFMVGTRQILFKNSSSSRWTRQY